MKTFHRLNILDVAGSNRAMQKTTNFVVQICTKEIDGKILNLEIPPKNEKGRKKKEQSLGAARGKHDDWARAARA